MATVLCVKDNLFLVAQALLCQEHYGDVSQCNYANVDPLPMQLFP